LIHIVERARRIFNLDADLDAVTGHLDADPTIGPLLRARPGLRAPGTWDPFETGVRAIIGQQVSVSGAGTIASRVVQRHGTPVPGLHELELTHCFPSPTTLATADLTGLGFTSSRAAAIRNFAGAVAGDAIRLDRSVGLERLVTSVTAVPGLGPWTAHYLALRLGEPDAFPAADLGLRRAVEPTAPLSTTDLTQLAEQWRPWRALAAVHLWLSERRLPSLLG
jgi:AraC family transcriptional regulator of adaptative response / DNA-3-methyladenine glycosylase II